MSSVAPLQNDWTLTEDILMDADKDIEEYSMDKNIHVKALGLIYKFSGILGITFKKHESNHRCTLSYWDLFINLVESVIYVISLLGSETMKISSRVTYTVYVYITLGQIIRICLIFNRGAIYSASGNLGKLLVRLKADSPVHFKAVIIQLGMFVVWIVCIAVMSMYFFATVEGHVNIKPFGYNVDISNTLTFDCFIRLCLVLSTVSTTSGISLALIICSNLYFASTSLLMTYGQGFSKITSADGMNKKRLVSFISAYRQIISCIGEIDAAVSGISLLLYATSVTCFFNMISIMLLDANIRSDVVILVQAALTFIMGLVIFFSLTNTGSPVISQYETLKSIITKNTENIFMEVSDTQIMIICNSLIQIVNNNYACFTGGGMFNINKGLLLTTAG
ncbi:hypothetical protein X975_24009, partial [Stegodyphus mimosarum]